MRLTEEQVRERLRARYGRPHDCRCGFCRFLDGNLGPGKALTRIHREQCPAVGVRWTGDHYEEADDGR